MAVPERTAFSASGEDAITRTIDVQIDETASSSREFGTFYEIERTANEIVSGDFKRVSQIYPVLSTRNF